MNDNIEDHQKLGDPNDHAIHGFLQQQQHPLALAKDEQANVLLSPVNSQENEINARKS